MTFFDSIDLTTAIAGLAVCFVGGMVGGLSGYGAGLVVTLFITPIIGPAALIPVLSVMMLINNASRVWFYRDAIQLRLVLKLAAVSVPFAVLGAHLYVRMDAALIQGVLGGVLVLSVPVRRWLDHHAIRPGPRGAYVVGGVFGFLSSLIVGAGMLVVPMLMGLGLLGPALLATDAALAVIVNLAKAIVFGALDSLSLEFFLLALLMGLCTVPGTACAAWIVRRTSIRLHTFVIEGLIVVGGTAMAIGALSR